MSEPAYQQELAAVAEAVITALASIAASPNPEVAVQTCDVLTRISTSFLLNNIGPAAAKNHLASVWHDLGEAIAAIEPVITPVAII